MTNMLLELDASPGQEKHVLMMLYNLQMHIGYG